MRASTVFAILYLAIGVASSFASRSTKSGRIPNIIRGSGGGSVSHPGYRLQFESHPLQLRVPPEFWHNDPAQFSTHPGYQDRFGGHPARFHVPFQDWNTDPAQFPIHHMFHHFEHHPAQMGIPYADWTADPTREYIHSAYLQHQTHPARFGIARASWRLHPNQLGFLIPPAQGEIQWRPPSPPPDAR
ncbi:hypothetical protein F5148DRAFT_1251321 [Russula earlei]|uniref:Uncharacterized protein n=1 Tax=Russula earlei TaxID=71964 RepID=A0ACC0TTQ1_9AGAM|nr:hypothetical protein F5148DRAFT_1251321 [Russula earlei]